MREYTLTKRNRHGEDVVPELSEEEKVGRISLTYAMFWDFFISTKDSVVLIRFGGSSL